VGYTGADIALVTLHLGGVPQRENLVRVMISGRKRA
jgi:hypothetical protein